MPNRAYKATGTNLAEERDWFLAGCPDEEGIRQRRARLSDEGAAVSWNRFLMLVQFVDETLAGAPQDPSPGYLEGVKDYLEPGNIQQFLDYYAWEDKVSKGYAGPYSTGWIETIQRSLSALRDPFLKSSMSEAAFKAWCDKFKHMVAVAKDTVNRRASEARRRDDVWVADADAPEGGRIVRKPALTWEDVLSAWRSYEQSIARRQFDLQRAIDRGESEAEVEKKRLRVAEMWRAKLASGLLLWHGGRTSHLRRLAVNWDIFRSQDKDGADIILMDAVQDKTRFRRESAEQKKDVPKVLHAKMKSVYEAYMRTHLPVIRRNLGAVERAATPEFQDDVHGPGASRCFCLFPGFWTESRNHAFVQQCLLPALGARERVVRSLQIKELHKHDLTEWGTSPEAIAQQFHHSVEIQNKCYKYGQRNTTNLLQEYVMGWDQR
ncbi:unnamed protein product [Effrenium voratum]|nr:unnamed protein product [Effrenium voratum]